MRQFSVLLWVVWVGVAGWPGGAEADITVSSLDVLEKVYPDTYKAPDGPASIKLAGRGGFQTRPTAPHICGRV